MAARRDRRWLAALALALALAAGAVAAEDGGGAAYRLEVPEWWTGAWSPNRAWRVYSDPEWPECRLFIASPDPAAAEPAARSETLVAALTALAADARVARDHHDRFAGNPCLLQLVQLSVAGRDALALTVAIAFPEATVSALAIGPAEDMEVFGDDALEVLDSYQLHPEAVAARRETLAGVAAKSGEDLAALLREWGE